MAAEVIRDKDQMRVWSPRRKYTDGKTVALVPTMGYLHDGHLSLVKEARAHADALVVSIYLNPSQFSPSEDLSTYPSDFAGDLQKLADAGGVDAVFCPTPPPPPPLQPRRRMGERWRLVSRRERKMGRGTRRGFGWRVWIRACAGRAGRCSSGGGVATVVAKLFNIVEPDVAVFGKKDYQQWRIICRMVLDRGEKIELLVDKTESLQFQADSFQRQGRQLRQKMWLQNLRFKLMVAAILIAVILLLVWWMV